MGGSCWGAVTNLSQLIGFGRALRTCPHRRLSRPRRPRASNPRVLIGPRACPACPRASRAPSASTPTPARTAATPTAHARHARVPCARTTSRSRPAVLARRLPRTQAIARKSTGNTWLRYVRPRVHLARTQAHTRSADHPASEPDQSPASEPSSRRVLRLGRELRPCPD